MIKKNLLILLSTCMLFTLVISSCSIGDQVVSSKLIQKRKYNKGYHIGLFSKKSQVNKSRTTEEDTETVKISPQKAENEDITASINNAFYKLSPENKTFIAKKVKKYLENECDVITLNNGKIIKAKVLEIGSEEIKYKKCNYENGPTYRVKKNEVNKIVYPNGDQDVFSEGEYVSDSSSGSGSAGAGNDKRIEPLSLISFIAGMLGLVLFLLLGFPFLLGTTAVILGMLGLKKFKNEPEKWEGKGFAIAGLILGILILVIFWLLVILIIALLSAY